eukprot:1020446-Pyramimonas_sp.AAC.1
MQTSTTFLSSLNCGQCWARMRPKTRPRLAPIRPGLDGIRTRLRPIPKCSLAGCPGAPPGRLVLL